MSGLLNNQFVQVALPIMITLTIASWVNNRRIDDLRSEITKRLDDIVARLARIETRLEDHTERIVRLETQASPIARGR